MALKIRLRPQGRKNRPFYRVVVTESTNRRDGAYVEALGWYNPVERNEENVLKLDAERTEHWLNQGAQPTEKVLSLIAKGAPNVYQAMTQRLSERQAKLREKRKAAKKAKAAS